MTYQTVIKHILSEYAKYTPAYGEISSRLSFDDEQWQLRLVPGRVGRQ